MIKPIVSCAEVFHKAVVAAMPGTDVLVINEIEAGNAFGDMVRLPDGSLDFKALSAAAVKFFEAGLHRLLVIHYPEGSYALDADGTETVGRSYAAPSIAGSTGAGDATKIPVWMGPAPIPIKVLFIAAMPVTA